MGGGEVSLFVGGDPAAVSEALDQEAVAGIAGGAVGSGSVSVTDGAGDELEGVGVNDGAVGAAVLRSKAYEDGFGRAHLSDDIWSERRVHDAISGFEPAHGDTMSSPRSGNANNRRL